MKQNSENVFVLQFNDVIIDKIDDYLHIRITSIIIRYLKLKTKNKNKA